MASYKKRLFLFRLNRLLFGQSMSRRGTKRLVAAMVLSFLSSFIWLGSFSQEWDYWMLTKLFEWRGPINAPDDIVIVAQDDETISKLIELGYEDVDFVHPLPRKYHATVFKRVSEAKPKLVVLDKVGPRTNREPEADKRIIEAINQGPFVLIQAQYQSRYGASIGKLADKVLRSDERFIKAAKMEIGSPLIREGYRVRYISSDLDSEDPKERVPLARPLTELLGMDMELPAAVDYINYYGHAAVTFNRIAYHELINPDSSFSAKDLEGKIVMIGTQKIMSQRGELNSDEFLVPLAQPSMYGVEILATIVANLIEQNWIKRFPLGDAPVYIMCATLVLFLCLLYVPYPYSLLGLGLLAFALPAASYVAFTSYRFFLPGTPQLTLFAIVMAIGVYFYFNGSHVVDFIEKFKKKLGIEER